MKILNNQKGVALMMVMMAVVMLSFLAVEISYEVGLEYRLSKNQYDELKARYAAKSGFKIGLLRVAIYKNVYSQFGSQIPDPSMLDLIWNFPFSWPPPLPPDASIATKEEMSSIKEDTLQDSAWTMIIQSEGNKIDLNDLNSPSETLAKATYDKIFNILEQRVNQDDEWAQQNRNLQISEIVNNIKDWVDLDKESPHAGSESSLYRDITEIELPPNRDFRTLDELHMVAGVTDEIYELLAPNVTVYGIKGINVNYADKGQLMSIDPQITQEVASEILKRRNDPQIGPFRDLKGFEGFISGQGVDLRSFNESGMPLRFDKEFNFRIESIGMFGNRTKKITAIVYDYTNAKKQIQSLLEEEIKQNQEDQNPNGNPPDDDQANGDQTGNQPGNQNQQNQNKQDFDKGKPRIIYLEQT